MSREVRKVPADWKHPKLPGGGYKPLFDGSDFEKDLAGWDEGKAHWDKGEAADYSSYPEKKWRKRQGDELNLTYEEWDKERPKKEDYMPVWSPDQKTHFQMYETTSEGTPISPPMETPEKLAQWLTDNKASAFANQTATYEQWLATVEQGATTGSAIIADGKIKNSVSYAKRAKDSRGGVTEIGG